MQIDTAVFCDLGKEEMLGILKFRIEDLSQLTGIYSDESTDHIGYWIINCTRDSNEGNLSTSRHKIKPRCDFL